VTRSTEGAKLPADGRGFTVRELHWTDLDDLAATFLALYDEREVNPEIGISLFATRPSYEDEVRWFSDLFRSVLRGESVVAVAESEGHAVGNCTVRPVGPPVPSELSHYGQLGILVDRGYRGRGIGRALIDRALKNSRGRFELVRLDVFANNVGARRLYERVGFHRIGTTPHAVRRGPGYIDVDAMVIDLRAPAANR
jgi:ribosomal protein S18 acetylase RimI-like enzyme